MIGTISKAIKVMDSTNKMDMEYEEERRMLLTFDEVEVASFIVMVRNMQSIKITLAVVDDN